MKLACCILLISLFSLQVIWADWVMLQKTTNDGKTQELRTQIKGDKSRMDIGEQMSLITDGAAAEIVMLMHSQKVIMKVNSDSLKGLMALAGGALGSDGAPSKPTATGQMERVGDYECEIYNWSGKLGSGKFWVAKDFPHFQELSAVQDKMMKGMGNPAASFAPQASDFPGMVVKSEMQVMGKTNASELVSVKEAAVEEAIFTLPADYQEMKMPGLPRK